MKKGENKIREEKGESVGEAARETKRKIAFLLRKPIVRQEEVYNLAKKFFKSYLQHDYEFTMDELKQELHKVYLSSIVRERVDALIEKLGLLEYTDTQYSQAELQLILQDLNEIIRDLVVEHRQTVPWLTRFANWLFRKSAQNETVIISEYPKVEPQDNVAIELNGLLEKIYIALEEGKKKRAAHYYEALLNKYNRLGTSVQEQFYHKLNEAYKAIVSAS